MSTHPQKNLQSVWDEYAFKENPPFAGSHDLYRHIKQATPDSLQYYLEDTWEKITLDENRAKEAKAKKLGDNTYEVTLKLASQKIYADSLGMETNAKYVGDYIDIGVFAAEGTDQTGRTTTTPLFLKKYKIAPGKQTIAVKVKGEPVKVGIDPYNKLIDRRPDDNTISVDFE